MNTTHRELNPYAPPFYPSRFNHHHASITNRVVPNRKPKDKPRFNEGAKRLFIKIRIRILEGQLEMERHPENHTLESAAIL
ncbi:hypothetical protein Tco_1180857, partial [Tanacetum coccineum]